MTSVTTILDLYDVALEGTVLSEAGRDACPLCGYEIRPDQPVIVTDHGEVCDRHLLDSPEWCLLTEWCDPAPFLARYAAVLGTTRLGDAVLIHPGVWQAVLNDGRAHSPYPSKEAAAQGVLDLTYPKEH